MKTKQSIIKKLADLPNIDGYEFLALKTKGKPCFDKVVKNEKGLHVISDYKNTIGWICLDKFKYFIYEGKVLIAVQNKIENAMKYYKDGRSVFYGTPENHTTDVTENINFLINNERIKLTADDEIVNRLMHD